MRLDGLLAASALVVTAALARAEAPLERDEAPASEDPPPGRDPSPRHIERPEIAPSSPTRDAVDVLLFPPRMAANLLFAATGATFGLIEDEQVVPRLAGLWSPREGEVTLFPTVFLETGEFFNVGGRLVARGRRSASSFRVGYGGSNELVAESKLRMTVETFITLALAGEAFHERRVSSFRGVGQVPENDPRNQFNPGRAGEVARYVDIRERFIASLGGRVLSDLELFLSSSLRWRRTEGPPAGEEGLNDVFVPGSITGELDRLQLVYTEATARYDSRVQRGAPSRGALFEVYSGQSRGLYGTDAHFARAGGRAAAFVPVMKATNIFSPKIVVDALQRIEDEPVPFTELTRQPDFRGFDNRRDDLSVVASLDYRWAVWKYLAARLFFDVARVAPDLSSLRPTDLRWATGFGFDVFSSYFPLGNVALSASPEGVRFVLHFGVAPSFGDRQHW